ncbi:ABC transporter substrate-binding protein [Gordonia sp. PDNC005]|uniref:taurine ABC transporter substrate-binding protein n=1 Tax=unclassified Gordonia (in: high G+C Gram-positive bacteria) TaxID=2657482 RepID=UPI001965004E|nr:ABC transporter substrate-binding protein [Gordonia sp. PDNC005]QRY63128.1 ABC transporter substrate-binding protein [Gordonia sp. PDNC005]
MTTSTRFARSRGGIKTRLLAAVVAVAAVAGLSACAIGDGTDSSKPTIRLAYQSFPSGDLIVKNNHWLEDALPDYNIAWTKFDSGADINTAFVAGKIDFGAIGSSPVARGLSDPLRIDYKVAFVLDVAGDNEALVARNGSGINSVADLKGKRVATAFASTAHYSLLAALRQANVDPASVDLIDLQPQASLAAWQRGDIDAVYTWLPTLDELRKDGKTLITSREIATAGKPTLDLAVVSGSFAKDHPDVVDTWRKVQARALRLIHSDPAAAAKAIAAQLGTTEEDAAAQLKQGTYLTPEEIASPEWLGTDGKPGRLAFNLFSAAQFLAEQKQIPTAPSEQEFGNALYTKGLPDVLADK